MRAETPTCDEACCNRRSLIGDVAVVETLRLRALQQPVHAERLLEAFATRANIVPKNSYRIRDPDALPLTLQRVMFNAAQEGRIWVCGRVDLTAGSFRHRLPTLTSDRLRIATPSVQQRASSRRHAYSSRGSATSRSLTTPLA
jgi:hypothetical protein